MRYTDERISVVFDDSAGFTKAIYNPKDKFNMNTTHFILVSDTLPTKDIQELSGKIENIEGRGHRI